MRNWLNKNIIALSLVSLFDDFAYELTIAILPAFLISINSSAATFGLIVGIANLFSFLKIISGRLSDKLNTKKQFAVVGYVISSINLCILPFATNWIIVFTSWIFAGIGKSIREPARNALLIESTTPKYYGRVFGFHRTIDSIGAILGPASALFLISFLTFNYIFLISFLASAMAVLILILFVTQAKTDIKISEPISLVKIRELPKQFNLFLIASGVFSLGNFANSLLIFRTIELFSSQKTAILLYTLYNICYTLFSYPAGHLADKFGTKNILTFGYFITALVSVGFMFNINLTVITILFILSGIAAAITNSMSKSLTANLIDGKNHGTGFGLHATISGFAFMIANFIVGFLWSKFSPMYGFGYSAVFCLLGTILLFSLVKNPTLDNF
ncbi:MAG: MFS transporter [Candidatus Babeliales bacterium]|nr:MFS transporter [Candidatus Babeliales bacterium]